MTNPPEPGDPVQFYNYNSTGSPARMFQVNTGKVESLHKEGILFIRMDNGLLRTARIESKGTRWDFAEGFSR